MVEILEVIKVPKKYAKTMRRFLKKVKMNEKFKKFYTSCKYYDKREGVKMYCNNPKMKSYSYSYKHCLLSTCPRKDKPE